MAFYRCDLCDLRQRIRFLDGKPYEVRYQLPGGHDWIDPAVLLRVRIPASLCRGCGGDGCARCADAGVVFDDPLTMLLAPA